MKFDAGKPNIILISGISGSGKSSALKILEDRGFFCVDNMPMLLLPKFFELGLSAKLNNIVFMVDIREKSLLDIEISKSIDDYIKFLRSKAHFFKYIFFEAENDTVIKRYSETRRKHPVLEKDISLSIRKEREMLKSIKLYADVVLDTTNVKIHDLKTLLLPHIGGAEIDSVFSAKIMSFGFKYGIPLESDTIFDARFLPNPFFISELKMLTGLDKAVADYMSSFKETDKFLEFISSFLSFTLPLYKRENKAYFTVAVGCTGGVHRSVFITSALKKRLDGLKLNEEFDISYYHRDLNRE